MIELKQQLRSYWCLEEAIQWIRAKEQMAAELGYHLGLTGSVLFKGYSHKDLDVILYYHGDWKGITIEPSTVIARLELQVVRNDEVSNPYLIAKELHICTTTWLGFIKRIDVFVQ